jgi:hypothetical protein
VLLLRPGVRVDVLGESDAWVSVRAAGRQGYLPRNAVGVVR